MTSLFSSKWLACALVLVGVALIRTSLSLKCHICSKDEPCEVLECIDDSIFLVIGYDPGRPIEPGCYSVQDASTGKGISNDCTLYGDNWAALVGGPGKCEVVDQAKVWELEEKDFQEHLIILEKLKEWENNTIQTATSSSRQGMSQSQGRMQKFAEKSSHQGKGQGRSVTSESYRVCACNTNMCNSEGVEKPTATTTSSTSTEKSQGVSRFDVRNGAIIDFVLAAFACLLVHGV